MTIDELIDAWRANETVNIELLSACTDDDLELKPGKGKTIRSNYVHIIDVRRTWSDVSLKERAGSIRKLDWKTANKKELEQGLKASSAVMESLLRQMDEKPGRGKWTLAKFFAYCVAHEAHHRSQIELALRLNGREPEDAFLYGLWEWNKKP